MLTLILRRLAGIPEVASVEGSVTVTGSREWTWGEENSFTTGVKVTFPVIAGPNKIVHAAGTATQGTLSVPYTMTLRQKEDPHAETENRGVWQGLSTWNVSYKLEEVVGSIPGGVAVKVING